MNGLTVAGVVANGLVVLAALAGNYHIGLCSFLAVFAAFGMAGAILIAAGAEKLGAILVFTGSVVFVPLGFVGILGARKTLDQLSGEDFRSAPLEARQEIFMSVKMRRRTMIFGIVMTVFGVLQLLANSRPLILFVSALFLVVRWRHIRRPLIQFYNDHLRIKWGPLSREHYVDYNKVTALSYIDPWVMRIAYEEPDGKPAHVDVRLKVLDWCVGDYLATHLHDLCPRLRSRHRDPLMGIRAY